MTIAVFPRLCIVSIVLLTALCAVILHGGCASVSTRRPAPEDLVFSPQWREPAGSEVRTLEVFVENRSCSSVALSEVGVFSATQPLWQHVRPSARVRPGGHAVITLCFTNTTPRSALKLRVGDESRRVLLPAFSSPEKQITDIAWSRNGNQIFVQTESRNVPLEKIFVNGSPVSFNVFSDGRAGHPFVVAATVRPKKHNLVCLIFADGERVFASCRPLFKPVLEVQCADDSVKGKLKADINPVIISMPYGDAGCYDLETGIEGSAAAEALGKMESGTSHDDQLLAVQFCISSNAKTMDIYGAFADGAMSMPFPVLRYNSPARRLDCEERHFLNVRKCAAPRPVIWTAPMFRHGQTVQSADEIISSFWMTLALGSRGVSAYLWQSVGEYTGMDKSPDLLEAWETIANTLNGKSEILHPLIPAGICLSEDGKVKVYTAWNPRKGMLVFWRTLSGEPLGEDRALTVNLPEWLKATAMEDLLTGWKIPSPLSHPRIGLPAASGKYYGVFWISAK